jgi:hypothetical protein
MKKLYSEARWKAFSRKKQERELKRRMSRSGRVKYRTVQVIATPKAERTPLTPYRKYTTIEAPRNFSFVNNTEEVIEFFDKMHDLFRNKKSVELDTSKCTSLTADTMTILISRLKDRSFTMGRSYRGNEPDDPKLRFIFAHSGFYDHVHAPRRRDKAQNFGSIERKKSKIVESPTAKALIHFATTTLFGQRRKLGGVYRVLVESMHNTVDHAHGRDISEKRVIPEKYKEVWWATVYTDTTEKKAKFTFVDNGVGIFKSKNVSILKSIVQSLSLKTDAEILLEMLRGEHTSRTGLPYRGKGLPGIYRAFQEGRLENLIVITNNVYANVGRGEFRMMNRSFDGTFLHWEISNATKK